MQELRTLEGEWNRKQLLRGRVDLLSARECGFRSLVHALENGLRSSGSMVRHLTFILSDFFFLPEGLMGALHGG
jgi:hypothetical protein